MLVNGKLDTYWYCSTICYAILAACCCLKEVVLFYLVSLPMLDHLLPLLCLILALKLLIPISQLDQLVDLMEKLAHLENDCCVWFGFFFTLTNLSHTPCTLIITRSDTKKVTVYVQKREEPLISAVELVRLK